MTVYRGLTAAHIAPVIISTVSPEALGVELANVSVAAPTSGTWSAANRALFIPFRLGQAVTVLKLGWVNGAAVSGNVDIAIYSESYSRIVSAGSTAASGTSAIQAVDTADVTLQPGRYYLALAADNTTQTFYRFGLTNPTQQMIGLAMQNTAFPLPATATPVVTIPADAPLCGLSLRNLLA